MTTPTVTPLYRVAEGIFEMHDVRVFNVLSDSTNRIHVVLVSHGHAHCDGPHCTTGCKHVRKVMAVINEETVDREPADENDLTRWLDMSEDS